MAAFGLLAVGCVLIVGVVIAMFTIPENEPVEQASDTVLLTPSGTF
jgi:hypothetical protein